ncbi:LysR family transcriptional regulator [Phaeovulum sp.]|uniref:LysR family transcriptional regulator n=1 Tax=Phaeovulum sp. TaxID=2934796 RepID=UPI0039E5A9CE
MHDIDWRSMPALTALRSFEVTARMGGFSAAARVLNVTHAAVAQQVRALEERLDIALVWRDGRNLRLTGEGERLALALNDGFGAIETALTTMIRQNGERPLTVTLPPAFAAEWLMPRLSRFWKRHPNVPLSLLPDSRVVDLCREGATLGIRFGDGGWNDVVSEFLTAAPQIVVGAPRLLEGRTQLSLREMSALPWVHEGTWPEQLQLLKSIGLNPDELKFTEFPNEELALSAAREGIGLHLESKALVEEDLINGWLVKVHELRDDTLGYYIVWSPGPVTKQAQIFIDWLKSEV